MRPNMRQTFASRGATNIKELCFFYCKNKHNLNFIRSKRQLKGYKFDGAKCCCPLVQFIGFGRSVSFVVKVTVLYEDIT